MQSDDSISYGIAAAFCKTAIVTPPSEVTIVATLFDSAILVAPSEVIIEKETKTCNSQWSMEA